MKLFYRVMGNNENKKVKNVRDLHTALRSLADDTCVTVGVEYVADVQASGLRGLLWTTAKREETTTLPPLLVKGIKGGEVSIKDLERIVKALRQNAGRATDQWRQTAQLAI